MNTLIAIGYIGLHQCYLNISKEEAYARYIKEKPDYFISIENAEESGGLKVIEFEDEFHAYEVYEK